LPAIAEQEYLTWRSVIRRIRLERNPTLTGTILITGASSGIGLETAEAFLAKGWTVGLVARSAERLEAIASRHSRAVPLPADVTRVEDVEAAVVDFVSRAGRLDVVFNNAGIFTDTATLDEISLEGSVRGTRVAAGQGAE
jgi:NADP-dependent 3-hydroxy acid dehydrogenase YdfG